MPRSRNPDSVKAENLYNSGMSLADIAKRVNKSEGTVRRWKKSQEWEKQKEEVEEEVGQVVGNPGLTDKQRLFCLYYVRCFNATKAYQKAYGVEYDTAASISYRLLKNEKVREEIQRMKMNRLNRELLDESDVFQKYMDIAFADITDFVEFGREKVPVMTMHGPLEEKNEVTGEKRLVMKEINTVKLKEHTQVDGTIVNEVKQGKDGASIKLADRMKALEWIADHMDLATEEQRIKLEMVKSKMNSDREMPIQITFTKASENNGKE